MERVKAKERQAIVGSQNLGLEVENFPPLETAKTRDIVADASGFGSGKQYEKAKYIADHAAPEVIAQLDADVPGDEKTAPAAQSHALPGRSLFFPLAVDVPFRQHIRHDRAERRNHRGVFRTHSANFPIDHRHFCALLRGEG